MILYSTRFRAMACPCEIKLWSADASAAERALAAAQAEVLRIEAKYSRYRVDSVIGRINAAAGVDSLEIDAETAGLLGYADQLWRHSEGRFDPTSGVLRRVWDFASGRLPEVRAVQELLPLIGWQLLDWSPTHVRLPKLGMQLDFGGFGKEYAVDRAIGVLLQQQMQHALVNLGGDVRASGAQAGGRPWRIGIVHPRLVGAVIATIELHEGAIATSGDSERFMEVAGRRYCHLLDARTGWPVADCAQLASVAAPLCLVAGSAATSALLAGVDGVAQLSARPHLWVDQSGDVHGSLHNTGDRDTNFGQ